MTFVYTKNLPKITASKKSPKGNLWRTDLIINMSGIALYVVHATSIISISGWLVSAILLCNFAIIRPIIVLWLCWNLANFFESRVDIYQSNTRNVQVPVTAHARTTILKWNSDAPLIVSQANAAKSSGISGGTNVVHAARKKIPIRCVTIVYIHHRIFYYAFLMGSIL